MALILGILAVLSVGIGMAVGMFGGGGSILTTPMLVYIGGFDPKPAIAASAVLVAVTSLIGMIQYARAGQVRWRTGLIFGSAGVVGALLAGQVGQRLPGNLVLVLLGVMMVLTALAMIRGRKEMHAKHHDGLPLFRILLDGFVVGIATGLVGAGGGFLVVPALVLLGGIPMQAAVGTSLMVVMMKAIATFISYRLKFFGEDGFVSVNPETDFEWDVTLMVVAFAIVGVFLGVRAATRIHPDSLRTWFGWFVLIVGSFTLLDKSHAFTAIFDFARTSVLDLIVVIAFALALITAVVVLVMRSRKDKEEELPDEPEVVSDDPDLVEDPY
ncbi:MAG: TSUP family transporter [Actinomycetales bacterium]|nr:TSUP family transporter [Actinomycetales bacterium]